MKLTLTRCHKAAIVCGAFLAGLAVAPAYDWVQYYLMINGYQTFDPKNFAVEQALGVLWGTVAAPESILGKTQGILDVSKEKLNINKDEQKTMAQVLKTFGAATTMDSRGKSSVRIPENIEMQEVTEATLPAAVEMARRLRIDPNRLTILEGLRDRSMRIQAFDQATRELEQAGSGPLDINARWALNNNIEKLRSDQINHNSISNLMFKIYDTIMAQWKIEDARLGEVTLATKRILASISGGSVPRVDMDVEYYAPAIERRMEIPDLGVEDLSDYGFDVDEGFPPAPEDTQVDPGSLPPGSHAGTGDQPWMQTASKFLGTNEISGSGSNPLINQFHASTGNNWSDDVPWCSSYVNYVMEQNGISGTGSASSQSWRNWGVDAGGPVVGSIVVFSWGGGKGHVGFVQSVNADGTINVLGGNQSNTVKVSRFSTSQVVGYRLPAGYSGGGTVIGNGAGELGDFNSTR